MALGGDATGVLTFADSTTDGDDATFTDLGIAGVDELKIGGLKLEGLDMAGDTAIFGKMSIDDIAITAPEGENGEVMIGNIELINPSPELAAWMAATLNGQEVPFPAVENVSFGSWSISDISAEIEDTDMDGSFSLGKIEIRDMADLKAARFLISGINFNGVDPTEDMNISASLGEMKLTNVDAKYVKAIQENIGDEDAMMGALMDAVYEDPMEPGYDAFSMSDLNLDIAGAKVAMASAESFIERNAAGQPIKYISKPYTLTIDADPEGGQGGAGLLQGLSVMGYENLVIKGESVADYDPDQDIMTFDAKNSFVEVEKGARFAMGGKIGGISEYSKKAGAAMDFEALASGGEPDPNALNEAMGALTFYDLTFKIDDDGLVNRALNAAATSQGQDPEQMKSQIAMGLGMAPMMAQGTGVDMALVTEATGALSKFIANPGTLTFTLKPSEPLSVAAMMANPDPSAYTKDSLGFTAKAD